MAKKSKTQRAKASAVRAEKKEQAKLAEEMPQEVVKPEPEKKGLFKKKTTTDSAAKATPAKAKKSAKEEKPKKERFKFLKDVKNEMKRVTWPSKQDVIRWSVVVVVALLFFGIFVALLDNVVITPALVAVSGLSSLIGA